MGNANITNMLYQLELLVNEDILQPYLTGLVTPSIISDTGSTVGKYAETGEGGITAIEAFIEIPAGKNIIVDATNAPQKQEYTGAMLWNAFYSSASEDSYLSTFSYRQTQSNQITVPSNARYFRMSFFEEWYTPAQLIKVYFV